ncbi:DUF2096 family protein [Methanocaldococcus indicus]|uniref:DUF2096 family protein n=1 Tax=Methanocaldococcus indicus TaxID=213231 RepID=UPI003C6D6C2D
MKDTRGLDKVWVVLSELAAELVKKDIKVPEIVFEKLRLSKAILTYYILDEHTTVKTLAKAEKELNYAQSYLFSLCDEELMNKYLKKLEKAITGELDVEFPLPKTKFDTDVKRRGNVESIRIKLLKYIEEERAIDLGEWHGVIFEYKDDEKVVIEGDIERVKRALKDFGILLKKSD